MLDFEDSTRDAFSSLRVFMNIYSYKSSITYDSVLYLVISYQDSDSPCSDSSTDKTWEPLWFLSIIYSHFKKIWTYFEILYLLGIEYLFIEMYLLRSDFLGFFFIHFDFKMVNQILGCKSEPQLVEEQGHIFTQCDPMLYWMLAHVFEDCLQIIQIWCSCAVFFMWHIHQLRLGPSSHSSISPSPYRNWNLISFMVAYFKILHNHFPTKLDFVNNWLWWPIFSVPDRMLYWIVIANSYMHHIELGSRKACKESFHITLKTLATSKKMLLTKIDTSDMFFSIFFH